MGIDIEVVREGVRLTLFGLSTAFGLLIILMIMTWTLGHAVRIQARWANGRSEAASRERALAAVVAVSTLLGTYSDTDSEAAAL